MATQTIREEALALDNSGVRLWGILTRPVAESASGPAVLIVVGGPQYRAGSHRMFVSLARSLARAGHPALRFDYTGMGDSDGPLRSFESAGDDIAAALDALQRACPESSGIVVWGLCDAASAALMFAAADARVCGIVAANPWARTDQTYAATRVRHYYVRRLLQADFWRKVLRGGLKLGDSLRSFAGDVKASRGGAADQGDYRSAMARGLVRLRGRLLLILSGNDLTAKEFVAHAESSAEWRRGLSDPKVSRLDLPEADHTFSRRVWMTEVENETVAWLGRLTRT